MTFFRVLIQTALIASVVAMLLLTFVWPIAVSADPDHPAFKLAAITTFGMFLLALAVLLAARLGQRD